VEDALKKANLFIGVSAPGIISLKALRRMASQPIVFALANPTPEIMPEEALQKAYIVATGRSDYPNQINNVLAFPGIFRGALNVRARRITEVLIACNFPKGTSGNSFTLTDLPEESASFPRRGVQLNAPTDGK